MTILSSSRVRTYGLEGTLAALYGASARTGKERSVNLVGGLRIIVRVTSAETALMLKREGDHFPSMVEWRTVVERWPCAMPKVEPAELVGDGWRALWARWPTKTVEVCTR